MSMMLAIGAELGTILVLPRRSDRLHINEAASIPWSEGRMPYGPLRLIEDGKDLFVPITVVAISI